MTTPTRASRSTITRERSSIETRDGSARSFCAPGWNAICRGRRLQVTGRKVEGGLSNLQPSTSGRPPGHARYLPQATVEGSGFKVEGSLSDSQLSTFNLQPSTSNQSPVAPLTLDQPVDTLPVVADFRWNRLASESPIVATLLWWLALSVMGWAVWPLLFPLLGGLQDRGYGLARTAGWLLVGWVHWMAVSLGLWQNRLAPLALICAGLILAGAGAWWIQRRRIGAFWAAAAPPAPGGRGAVRAGVPGFRRHSYPQPRPVAALERRREVHGIGVPECHPPQPALPAL